MIIAHPAILWLLPLAPLIAGLGLRGNVGGARRGRVAVLRTLCLAALILALSRPMFANRVVAPTHVLVVDLGPTTPDGPLSLFRNVAGDTRVIAYSNRAEVVPEPATLQQSDVLARLRARLARPVADDDLSVGGSAIAAALQLAGAQIGPNGNGSITLVSNGLATGGDAEAESYRLAMRGIRVDVVSTDVDPDRVPDVVVRSVTTTPAARLGQTIAADILIESRVQGDVRVTLAADSRDPVTATIAMTPGTRTVRLSLPLPAAGLTKLTASAAIAGSPPNEMTAAVAVDAPASILLVRDPNDASTEAALRRLLTTSAVIQAVAPADLTKDAIASAGTVVLADVPADSLGDDAQQAIRTAVSDGTGLLLTGAARSFGPGGYDTSPLASLLPVRMSQRADRIDPSITLVLIIDTSGSMEGPRIDLAKEVARLAISHLKPHDKIGIVEFYGGKRWALPIQSAANKSIISRALGRLTAGGSTTLYPAIEEASFALRNIDTRGKHVMILSDGGVESAAFAPLLRQMAEDGIAVSGVAVAPDPRASNMMPDLARWGGGRFYTVPDQFEIPDVTLKQPQFAALSPVVPVSSAVVGRGDPLVRTVDTATWPALSGHVRVAAKPTADVVLATSEGDPLLVRWRYGTGFVAALPTQLGSTMTQALQDEPGFARLIADLFRQIGKLQIDRLDVRPRMRAAGVEVDVAATDAAAKLQSATLRLNVIDERGATVRTTHAEPIGAGRWNVLLTGVARGAYKIAADVETAGAWGQAGFAVAGPREWPRISADAELLDRIRGFRTLADERARLSPASSESLIELRNAFSAAAVALLVLHVLVRRKPKSRRYAS